MLVKKPSSRDTLLSAALDAFGRHGFDSASTRDIAKSAGMPMSQITYHFGGKDGLYLACATRKASSWPSKAMGISRVGSPVWPAMRATICSMAARMRPIMPL